MAGCFGNHPVDRYLENQLNRHLEEESTFRCPECEFVGNVESMDFDENEDLICPGCGYVEKT